MNTNNPSQHRQHIAQRYHQIATEHFPPQIEISFIAEDGQRQLLLYEKVGWKSSQGMSGIRYGDNPSQPAALYRLINGNVEIAGVTQIAAQRGLVTAADLLQSGKHPGKTNLIDIDVALQILRYLAQRPTAVIIKHNNPCAVASTSSIAEAVERAQQADPIAAFGGSYVLNRAIGADTAKIIAAHYCEVVAAPSFSRQAIDILRQRANLRIFQIHNIEKLAEYIPQRYLDWRALMDGGLCLQWSYSSALLEREHFSIAQAKHQGKMVHSQYNATPAQLEELLFGWHVVEALTSNAIVLVKNGCTVGIGCGSLDRVGAVRIACRRAYGALQERLAQEHHTSSYAELSPQEQRAINSQVAQRRGDLSSAVMVSDAFFPFPDGVRLALEEGIAAIAEPGGAIRDWEIIACCNQHQIPLLFSGQRAFRH